MPGCRLWQTGELVLPMGKQGSHAALFLPVPDDPTLLGVFFHSQGFVNEPGINALGTVGSNGVTITVGT